MKSSPTTLFIKNQNDIFFLKNLITQVEDIISISSKLMAIGSPAHDICVRFAGYQSSTRNLRSIRRLCTIAFLQIWPRVIFFSISPFLQIFAFFAHIFDPFWLGKWRKSYFFSAFFHTNNEENLNYLTPFRHEKWRKSNFFSAFFDTENEENQWFLLVLLFRQFGFQLIGLFLTLFNMYIQRLI